MNTENRKFIFLNKLSSKQPALFLDRDGVIIEDKHYINDPNKVVLCPGIREIINQANIKNWPIVVITNQSGISKKLLNWNDFQKVNTRIMNLIGNDNSISAIYANSSKSTKGKNNWRKPNPNMITDAETTLNLDLRNSILIGDRLTDIQAGKSAGIKFLIHVETGHGIKERNSIMDYYLKESSKFTTFNSINKMQYLVFLKNLTNFPLEIII